MVIHPHVSGSGAKTRASRGIRCTRPSAPNAAPVTSAAMTSAPPHPIIDSCCITTPTPSPRVHRSARQAIKQQSNAIKRNQTAEPPQIRNAAARTAPSFKPAKNARNSNTIKRGRPGQQRPVCQRLDHRDIISIVRGVAQPGRAPDWGSGGRRFESCRPDHLVVPIRCVPYRSASLRTTNLASKTRLVVPTRHVLCRSVHAGNVRPA